MAEEVAWNPVKCGGCSNSNLTDDNEREQLFNDADTLWAHISMVHAEWVPYQCVRCPLMLLPSEVLLKHHYLQFHPGTIPKAVYTYDEEKKKKIKQIFLESQKLAATPARNHCAISSFQSNHEPLPEVTIDPILDDKISIDDIWEEELEEEEEAGMEEDDDEPIEETKPAIRIATFADAPMERFLNSNSTSSKVETPKHNEPTLPTKMVQEGPVDIHAQMKQQRSTSNFDAAASDGGSSDVSDEAVNRGEEDIDDAKANAIREKREAACTQARMEELREAMGVKNLKRRLLHDSDDAVDHRHDQPSEGVEIHYDDDKRHTAVVSVQPGCVLRLGPRSRRRAAEIADATYNGTRGKNGRASGVGASTAGTASTPLWTAGSAAHQFAKMAQEYYTGGITVPPNVYRYGVSFSRPHSKPLRVRFAAIPRPYRDGLIEGILHFWTEFSEMSDKEFDSAIKLAIDNGSKGSHHSEQNVAKREGDAAQKNKRKAKGELWKETGPKKKKTKR